MNLLAVRLILAFGGLVSCSRSSAPIGPEAEGDGGAGRPGAMRRAEEQSGSGAGPTALCNEQIPCVVGTWCGHYTSNREDFFGRPMALRRCNEQGRYERMSTQQVHDARKNSLLQMCLPKEGPCPAFSKELIKALEERKPDSCGTFELDQTKLAEVKMDSAGKEQCCYAQRLTKCEGRPLLVQGQLRHAARRGGLGWG